MEQRMENKSSIKKNFVMNAILQLSSVVFPLITFPYVNRILLPVGTGKVSFAVSLIAYFNIFAQLGVPTYGIRACAKARDSKLNLTRTVHELLIINLITSTIAYLFLIIALLFIPRLQDDRCLYIIVSSTIFLNTIGMEWLYKGLEQYKYITVRSVCFKFVALIAMFLLIHQQNDYMIYGFLTIFAASASNLLNFVHAHKYIDMRYVGGYQLGKHIKAVSVFFAMACATTIYTNLDTIMLGFMTSDIDVGYYNAAIKSKNVLVSLVASLGAVLLPRNSYYIEHNMLDEFKKVSNKALEFVFVAAMPLLVFFIIFAEPVILLLAGPEYYEAILPMKVIMPTLLFIGITNVLGLQILVPLGREKIVLYSEIVGALVDLVLNAILIPVLHSTGAALGTLVAEFVVLIVQFWCLRSEFSNAFKSIHYGRLIIGVALASFSSFWVLILPVGSIVQLVISSILFFGIYIAFLVIRKDPIVLESFKLLRGLLEKR